LTAPLAQTAKPSARPQRLTALPWSPSCRVLGRQSLGRRTAPVKQRAAGVHLVRALRTRSSTEEE
jgi:hypothetical protein